MRVRLPVPSAGVSVKSSLRSVIAVFIYYRKVEGFR
jgi:hypothetical protein